MRLGPKSKIVLELLFATDGGILEMSYSPMRALMRPCGYDTEYELIRQLDRMGAGGWIEWKRPEKREDWVARLTEQGRQALLQEIEPQSAWDANWHGEWHLVAFDLPSHARSLRRELDIWLRKRRFGRLQGSVWIAPRFSAEWVAEIGKMKVKPDQVSFMTSRASAICSDGDFVSSAWDFNYINGLYQLHMRHLKSSGRSDTSQWIAVES